jgi:hypothetical protein
MVGTSKDYARADHVHQMSALNAVKPPPGAGEYFIVAAGILNKWRLWNAAGSCAILQSGPVG